MLLYAGKVTLMFVFTIFVIRLVGKAVMAQITPHDITAVVFLATLAVRPIMSESLVESLIGIIVVAVIYIFISRLALVNGINKWILGEPTILVKKGSIIKKNLKRSRYSLIELLSSLRQAGYPDMEDVEYAILEPNGAISVLPKKEIIPVTPRHLHIESQDEGIPISVIIEGRIQHKNLRLIHKNEQWLREQLAVKGITIETIFYAAVRTIDHSLIVDTGKG